MPLDNDAVFTAAVGYILVGDVDADKPTPAEIQALNATTLPAGYELIGHTSREELPEFGFDGGDTEVRGSWQNQSLRTVVTETPVDYVTFQLLEFNELGLSYYYGQQEGEIADDNVLDVFTAGGETQKSLIVAIVDGTNKVAMHAAKVGIRRDDAISLSVDEFGALPLRATFLQSDEPDTPMFSWVIGSDGS